MSHLQQSLSASSVAQTLATYEAWAKVYNQDVESEGYVAPALAAEYVAKFLTGKNISEVKILDAGCGTGLVGEHLLKRGARQVDGIDLSPAMLDIARQTGAYEALTTANLSQHLEIESASYDVVTCVGTLTQGHVGPEALDELVRVVKSGGIIVATVRKSVWKKNGYEDKMKRLISQGKAHLMTGDVEEHRVAKDVDLVYATLQVS